MKRTLMIVLALAIAGVAAFFAVRYLRLRSFAEGVFPADTILLAQVSDTTKAGEAWKQSNLGKAIEQSPRKEVYRRLGERMALSVETATGADARPFLRQFTGQVVLGIFPLPTGRRGLGIAGYVKSESETRKYIEQTLDPAWRRRDPGLKKETITEEGSSYYKYSSVKFPPVFQPCYAILDHHLLIAHNQDSMRRLLETRSRKTPGIRSQKLYEQARDSVDYREGALVYLNAQAARTSLEADLPAQAKILWPQVVQASGVDALEFVAWKMNIANGDFEGRGFAGVGANRSGALKVLMERAPAKLQGQAGIPEYVHFFYAATLPDFARFNQEGGPNWARIWIFVQALTGFDVRAELLESLGDEFAVFTVLHLPETGSEELAAKTAVLAHLRHSDRFAGAIERILKLTEARGLERTIEPYNGANLAMFRFSYGNFALTPAYSLQDNWFSFSTDAALLKSALDARAGRSPRMVSSPDFKNRTSGFPEEVNGISYTRVPDLLKAYAALFRREAEAEPWIREYGLDQELDYLSGKLAGSASFVRFEKNGIHFESRSSVPAGFLALPPLAARLPELIARGQESAKEYE